MAISYNKLWKLLVDKKMSKADLRKAAGIAPNTMTRLRRDEEVTLSVLNRICIVLAVNIGDIMEFTNDERDGEYDGREYLKQLEVKSIDRIFEYMDKELIQYIDATDNMQLEYLESKIVPDFIKLCNPEWNENVDESEAFINALRLADEFWNIYIKHAIAEVEAIEIILKSSDKCKECYLVFDVEMPYRKAIKYINNDKIKYMIFKSSREGYDIRAFRDYCKFKDEISHEADINIAKKITGIDDLIYVDINGKLCCTKTLESAIKILKYNEKMMEEI